MRLGEAVGPDKVGVLVHPLYHPGRWPGGGDPAEAAGAMRMELEKGTGCKGAIRGVGPACSSPQGLKAPPSHTSQKLRDRKCCQKHQPGPC